MANKILSRADKEETGLSTDHPERAKDESDTYWNTRFLTHSILGKHFRTPQYNLKLLKEYLNPLLPASSQIMKTEFQAPGSNNLRFPLKNGLITFDAHKPIDIRSFFKEFKIKQPETLEI